MTEEEEERRVVWVEKKEGVTTVERRGDEREGDKRPAPTPL